ncbi:4-hydroxy-3-methylbut-2-enyl diphosphate reductase [Carboxylicivirga linearis]|uniref:4-hydroxy-3-methylbut-2-enyl diphosphate reductase n=1 Tax=Carboxylicivirga linearis TaxID=1628157 RepID=A0ABS5JWG1_9BACT|nr:4-hydroxy-3-methylbut-2-enyl diphosphate reductase [Carboxylicivirga linearis]MBS2098814.1 4-hydroxy-3-methylbut-2-enyl diphosphate reductase [Carboxylicivirga linearis]
MVKVEIDSHSGFCFGVRKAIDSADQILKNGTPVYCVGDIVHNDAEAERLYQSGMKIISYNQINQIKSGTVLFRAHGEPPATYQLIKKAGLQLQDETCPVVLKLQQRIKKAYQSVKEKEGQLVIFGKRGHAEVIGLEGQCEGQAIVIEKEEEIDQLDFTRPIEVFAQTTKNPDQLKCIVQLIEERKGESITWHNTTCKQVTGRVPKIKSFAQQHNVIVFVGGKKSSNAKVLFAACCEVNKHSYFVSDASELDSKWLSEARSSIGVCGATSTPLWQMEEVAESIKKFL